jgi:hypothetical protein
MTHFDVPLFLHFLDPELGRSVGYRASNESCEDILKCVLLGTTSDLYCGVSQIWESDWLSLGGESFLSYCHRALQNQPPRGASKPANFCHVLECN